MSQTSKMILIAVVAALLAGSGVYLWQQNQPSILPLAGNQELPKEVVTPNQVKPTLDTRILLNPENIEQYNTPPNCQEKFNFDSADTSVDYANSAKGISVQIPYNPSWGSDKYKINPYDENEREVSFGPIGAFEACGWTRSYFIRFLPAKSADAVISSLRSETKPTKAIINGLNTVKYTDFGLCLYPTLQVIGKKYNYEFVPVCGLEIEKEFKFLENIVKTVKLVD